MVHVNAPGVLQVTQYFSSGSNNAANVFHIYNGGTAYGVTDVAAILAAFSAWESGTAASKRPVEVACTGFKGTDLTSLDGVSQFLAADIAGGMLAGAAPANVTFAIKLDTGKRGRGRNGRVFWYGIPEDKVDFYTVHTDYADELLAAIGGLITAIGATGHGQLAVMHTVRDGAPLNPYEASVVQRAIYSDLFIDSQKDRLIGHKRQKRRP